MSEEKVTLSDGKEAARQQILDLVAEYCDKYHNQKKEFTEGQRIPYASRVYDNHEMVNLVDSALEFWLTSGRYTDQFEAGLAKYLGVKYCSLVNSGSSANLIAFMALTSPLLGERRVRRGDEIITVAAGFPTTVTPAIPVWRSSGICGCDDSTVQYRRRQTGGGAFRKDESGYDCPHAGKSV